MIDSTVAMAVLSTALVFTALGFLWGFNRGFLLGVDTTTELLAREGYVKHTRLENGELKLLKLNEEK
jgi:hypothetical protein